MNKGSPRYEWCKDMLPVVQLRMDVGTAESPRGVMDRHIQQSLVNCRLEALRVWIKLRVQSR